MNKLYFGDCLDVLKKLNNEHPQGFIDLIYIDPPFNSKRNYNILFESADLKDAKAQKEAFADTWSNISYKDTLEELKDLDLDLFRFLESLDKIRVSKSAVAYLTTIAIRIHYMQKVLKDTGSFYLHCDPNMSHYLKIICDLVFVKDNFRNEVVWCYRKWSISGRQFMRNHDIILFYSKGKNNFFNVQYIPVSDGTMKRWKGKRQQSIYDEAGRRLATSVDDAKSNTPMPDWWEISIINPAAKERLGYPTQKPEALLKKIIEGSSKEGDLVADFFCGCGTTVTVAEELKRQWIGVDISHLAIGLIERRLIGAYGNIRETYEVDGLPKDVASAKNLAQGVEHGRLKFQDWVIETMLGGIHNPKKTADGGWDGHLTFNLGNKKEVILIEVKSGNVNVKNIREFIQVVNKQKANIGVFVCFEEQVTKPMLLAAKEEGYYQKERWGDKFNKIQILTVENLLYGKGIDFPITQITTLKTAEKKTKKIDNLKLFK